VINPVSSSIGGEGKAVYARSVDLVVKLEEDTEASKRKDRMRSLRENVIA
jgi:hypothetical protein